MPRQGNEPEYTKLQERDRGIQQQMRIGKVRGRDSHRTCNDGRENSQQ